MEIEEFDRRTFSVQAVQVTLGNVQEVADWCKGEIEQVTTKLMGTDTKLPAVRLRPQSSNKGGINLATLGCFVVEYKGSYRVYKPAQFHSSFAKKPSVSPTEQGLTDVLREISY